MTEETELPEIELTITVSRPHGEMYDQLDEPSELLEAHLSEATENVIHRLYQQARYQQ